MAEPCVFNYELQEKLRVAVLVSKAAFQFISGEFQIIIQFNKVVMRNSKD